RTNLAGAVDLQCREVEAHTGDVERYCEMLDIVKSIRDNNKLPDNVKHGSTLSFGATILAVTPAATRTALVNDWIQKLEVKKPQEEMFLDFRKAYKAAGQASLNGTTDAPALRKILRYRQWVVTFGASRDFGPITGSVPEIGTIYRGGTPRIEGEPGSRTVTGGGMKKYVIPGLVEEDVLVPGIDNITDAHIDFDNNLLYVGGSTNGEVNLGRLGTFDLDSETGNIINGSYQLRLETPMLNTGFDIVPNNFETENNLYGVKMETGDICRFMDNTGDGVPDMAMHVGSFITDGINPVIDGQFMNQDTIVGFPGPLGDVLDRDSMISCSTREDPVGMFNDRLLKRTGDFYGQDPSVAGLPFIGRQVLPVIGTPGLGFDVFFDPIEGGDPHLAGSGVFGHSGFACPPLNEVISADYFIRIRDEEGHESRIICARRPGFNPDFVNIDIGGPNDTWRGQARSWPGQPFASQNSWDMNTWDTIEMAHADAFGDKYFFFTPANDVDMNSEFWRILNNNSHTPPGGGQDTFSVTPGVKANLDLSLNAGISSYFAYELVDGPDLHEDLFQWNKDGSFSVSLLTQGGPVSFTYRRVSVNPDIPAGPLTTVLVSSDLSALTNPEPYGEEGNELVNVVVLEIGGLHYPLLQFRLAFSIFDVCIFPHWHSSEDVFPLEFPLIGGIPDPPVCGFGIYPQLSPKVVPWPKAEWDFWFGPPQ
ncbi:MAG: hypothetical protein O7C75_13175, partial [Verrucomicrobia bacterium]|nr:hypothetical protein [Verrucomicrobiota bacterium]